MIRDCIGHRLLSRKSCLKSGKVRGMYYVRCGVDSTVCLVVSSQENSTTDDCLSSHIFLVVSSQMVLVRCSVSPRCAHQCRRTQASRGAGQGEGHTAFHSVSSLMKPQAHVGRLQCMADPPGSARLTGADEYETIAEGRSSS